MAKHSIISRHLAALRSGDVPLLTRRDAILAAVIIVAGMALDQVLPPIELPPGTQVAFWQYIIVLVISALVSYALAPKPTQPPKPSLEDFDFPTAEEGRPIPVVFGTAWISGPNILWYGDLDTTAIRVKGGKK